jgi:Zn-dependent protease with chaperone function
MKVALLFGYAVIVAWSAPALLLPLTSRGISARLGLTAWLTAMASVLVCLGMALAFLVRAAVAGWPGLAAVVCRSVAGGACTPRVYRSALFEFGLSIAAVAAAVIAVVLVWRYGRSMQRARRGSRAHAEAAHLTGRKLPGPGLPVVPQAGRVGTVVLDSPKPVAYCVPGRPAAIVLSTGALALLDPAQLTAVLAHERAHLAGRHHLLLVLTRVLAATFPAVPLFTRGAPEVARLAEMCADDAAARRSGRKALLTALLAIGTGTAVPALAATGGDVGARVHRLLEPPHGARRARYGLALSCVTLLLPLAPLASAFLGISLGTGESAGRSRRAPSPVRKVRAPQGRVVGNADPGRPAGQCHRKQTAPAPQPG